jgi:ring-1,2-phenylacetyl-CoA epoxidase subunit PaaC
MAGKTSTMDTQKLKYTLQIADNALIMGHRLSEWCGHGPILEQDIALTNIALDHLGQARSLYQYAAEQFNELPREEKETLFNSTALQNIIASGKAVDEDDMAYLRDGWDFRNVLLTEQENKDWAYTTMRSLFYDAFNYFFYTALQQSKDETLAAIAEKSLKEVTYHLRWSSEWVIRLGDGTEESHKRAQEALDNLWQYTGELCITSECDKAMLEAGAGVNLDDIKSKWAERIGTILSEATLQQPEDGWMQQGGKEGKHTEHLGYVLAEMQYMQRTYPNMEW